MSALCIFFSTGDIICPINLLSIAEESRVGLKTKDHWATISFRQLLSCETEFQDWTQINAHWMPYQSRGVNAVQTKHRDGGLAVRSSGSGKRSDRRGGAQGHSPLGSRGADGAEDLSRQHCVSEVRQCNLAKDGVKENEVGVRGATNLATRFFGGQFWKVVALHGAWVTREAPIFGEVVWTSRPAFGKGACCESRRTL